MTRKLPPSPLCQSEWGIDIEVGRITEYVIFELRLFQILFGSYSDPQLWSRLQRSAKIPDTKNLSLSGARLATAALRSESLFIFQQKIAACFNSNGYQNTTGERGPIGCMTGGSISFSGGREGLDKDLDFRSNTGSGGLFNNFITSTLKLFFCIAEFIPIKCCKIQFVKFPPLPIFNWKSRSLSMAGDLYHLQGFHTVID